MQAYIAGMVPMSTVDWPKNVCTVIFFAGCDFNCPYCQNSDIITYKEEFLKDLRFIKQEVQKNLDFIDAIVFSGGEASLQRTAVLDLSKYAKQMGLSVGIESNGTKPGILLSLIKQGLLDFVAMDIKAPLTDKELFEKVTKSKTFFKTTEEVIESIRQSIELLKHSADNLEVEIRTTIVPGLIYRKEDLLKIAEEIKDLNCTWVLQQFRPDMGELLDPMLKSVNSPKKEFLENLKSAILKEYPKLRMKIKAV